MTEREPRRAADRRATVHGPNVPLPAVALLWQGPPASAADAAALQVAGALLSSGDSSRLNESLVYRTQMAQAAGFSAELYADAGMLTAYAIAASGQPLRKLEDALLRELQRLAREPIAPAELDKVRIGLLTGAVSGRQTPEGKASAVGWAALLHGDVEYANQELAQLQAVRGPDVQRVLQQALATHRVTVEYTQGAAA